MELSDGTLLTPDNLRLIAGMMDIGKNKGALLAAADRIAALESANKELRNRVESVEGVADQLAEARDKACDENKKLREALEEEKLEVRSLNSFEIAINQIGAPLKGIESEFVYFPEAVENLVKERDSLRDELNKAQAIIASLQGQLER